VFCAVLAGSRFRFVRFAADERSETMLAECFEALGRVPGKVLADRTGCLKGGLVANVVVPAPEYVRFASHYGFRPDFCEAADPESKGIVENLAGYARADLMVSQAPFGDLAARGMSPDMSMTPAPVTPAIRGHAAHSQAEDHTSAPPADSSARIRCSLSPAMSAARPQAGARRAAGRIAMIVHLPAPSPEEGNVSRGTGLNALPGPDHRASQSPTLRQERAGTARSARAPPLMPHLDIPG
jgi:hypothetical protein